MPRPRRFAGIVALLLSAAACAAAVAFASPQGGSVSSPKAWRIVAKKYAYSEPRIEVQQDDLVQITLETSDIPHSFTIDEPYRIAKRATPGHPVVFEFRADKVGTFVFYCNLKTDDGCRTMKGQLIVKPR